VLKVTINPQSYPQVLCITGKLLSAACLILNGTQADVIIDSRFLLPICCRRLQGWCTSALFKLWKKYSEADAERNNVKFV